MLKNALVFSASAAELVSRANAVAENTVLITTGSLSGADVVYTIVEGKSVATELKAIAELAAGLQPELVLCDASPSGRLAAGYIASALKTNVLADVQSLEISDSGLCATRMVYGGSFVKTESIPYPAVATVGAGTFETEDNMKASRTEALPAVGFEGLELLDVSLSEGSSKNLAAAKKVVCVGRGLSSADNLPLVDELAKLMDADIGCTRPAAEEENWYPKDRYIGISGVMLKASTYFGLGVSGQMQHMIGTRSCNAIFALDKNENAVIMEEADYALVGNVNTALPAIIEKLK